jgi:hypothetical protein
MAVHITLQLAIKFNIGNPRLGGLINTINRYRWQMNVQILMKHTERYERILDQFPLEALTARFDREVFSTLNVQSKQCPC